MSTIRVKKRILLVLLTEKMLKMKKRSKMKRKRKMLLWYVRLGHPSWDHWDFQERKIKARQGQEIQEELQII
jgi:hypothetical protein